MGDRQIIDKIEKDLKKYIEGKSIKLLEMERSDDSLKVILLKGSYRYTMTMDRQYRLDFKILDLYKQEEIYSGHTYYNTKNKNPDEIESIYSILKSNFLMFMDLGNSK